MFRFSRCYLACFRVLSFSYSVTRFCGCVSVLVSTSAALLCVAIVDSFALLIGGVLSSTLSPFLNRRVCMSVGAWSRCCSSGIYRILRGFCRCSRLVVLSTYRLDRIVPGLQVLMCSRMMNIQLPWHLRTKSMLSGSYMRTTSAKLNLIQLPLGGSSANPRNA